MIYLDSRYADGKIFKADSPKDESTIVTVYRRWPTSRLSFFTYEWVETDRLDIISWKFLGSPNFWWKILDFNPELKDCTNIAPGTQIRIPNV